MAKEFGCPFFETSAALRHNVDEIFSEIVRCIRKKESADYSSKVKRGEGKERLKSSKGGLSHLLCCAVDSTKP